jgi:ABC-type transport system involved in multi-copper enzyme maturation permease subunit
MTPLRKRRWYYLTRHFFNGLFDLGFLSEVGTDSFTRLIVGCCAAFLTFGLLLVRLFAIKYASLSAFHTAEPHRQALLADHAFLLALPMWVVAFVTVLVGHSLFPDETDFRVLMALPVSRRLIFGTKLLALALFASLFILAVHVALLPLLVLTSVGRWAEHAWPVQFAAYGVASLLASGFSVMAVTAVHGLLVMTAPRGRLLTASAALRSVMICVLVVSLPLVLRLPAQARPFADGSSWLYFAPPAWFLGVERWLLGDDSRAHFVRLAQLAGVALTLAIGLAAGSYIVLYRRFDRVLLRPAQGGARSTRGFTWNPWSRPVRSRPVFVGTRLFTLITLRRSVLHQGILVALSAAGAGLVANSLMAADLVGWLAHRGKVDVGLMASVIWAPFALMFVASLAVRMALAVPIEPRANWVFRITEQDEARSDQLEAAVHTVRRFGAIVPVVLMLPLEWLVLGWDSIGVLIVALLCGWLLVEILMKDWVRIPFTCSYIPGKGFVPQTILTGLVSFVAFTTAGALLARFTLTGHPASFALNAILLAGVLALRRYRLHTWKDTPLAFEDQLPTEVNPLRLSLD